MIPKSRKIQRVEFPQNFHNGYKYHSPAIFLLVTKQRCENLKTKYSFIISKKVLKSATKRIFLKRIGYNIIKNIINDIKPGFFCIFYFKKGSDKLRYDDIRIEIIKLLKKADILK